MLNRIIRYYNQNRKKIWMMVIVITFALAILQVANTIAKNNSERELKQAQLQAASQNVMTSSDNSVNSSTSESYNYASTQTQKTNENKLLIEQFVSYCNNGNLEDAYNMITDNCKEEMFSDIEKFKTIYYEGTFENGPKEAIIEKWANNTYLVKFMINPLLTGRVATTIDEQKIDYITVEQDKDKNYKLNINSYIGYKELAKSNTIDDVTIEVVGKHTYMDYEQYVVKVTNRSNNDVCLDSLYNSDKLYIEDSKGVKYSSYTSELIGGILDVSKGQEKLLFIKFFSSYVSTKKIQKLVFSDYSKGKEYRSFIIEL